MTAVASGESHSFAPVPMSEMKPMKGTLTPTQIWQVVNYIRSIGPPPPGKK